MKRVTYGMVAALPALMCAAAMGQTTLDDNFDSYQLGDVCTQSSWEGWDGNPAVCAPVSDEQANSGPNSLKLIGSEGPSGDDTVHRFEVDGGKHRLTIMTFVPDDATGTAWIIMLNQYLVPANNWSFQFQFNADTNLMQDSFSGPSTALIKGRWVEFRAEIDIDGDLAEYYYDGQLVNSKSWKDGESGGGLPQLRALDLYGDEPGTGTNGFYLDDIKFEPVSGPSGCVYTLKKNSKAKGGCTACPSKNDTYATGDACDDVKDCAKKVSLKQIDCPDGGQGTCKKIKGKRSDCV